MTQLLSEGPGPVTSARKVAPSAADSSTSTADGLSRRCHLRRARSTAGRIAHDDGESLDDEEQCVSEARCSRQSRLGRGIRSRTAANGEWWSCRSGQGVDPMTGACRLDQRIRRRSFIRARAPDTRCGHRGRRPGVCQCTVRVQGRDSLRGGAGALERGETAPSLLAASGRLRARRRALATSAPAAASRKNWLPVATMTSTTNGG